MMYRMPACRAATTFTVRTVSISDDHKFQCIQCSYNSPLPDICVPVFLLLSQPKERYTYDVCICISRGPKRPIVRDIVLTNLYITAALFISMALTMTKGEIVPTEKQIARIYARLISFILITLLINYCRLYLNPPAFSLLKVTNIKRATINIIKKKSSSNICVCATIHVYKSHSDFINDHQVHLNRSL